jgi:hypothetical protein
VDEEVEVVVVDKLVLEEVEEDVVETNVDELDLDVVV